VESDHVLTPETEKYFFQKQLLPPLLRGECVSVLWFPHGGAKTQFDFLVNNADCFGYHQLGKYKIITIGENELANFSADGCFALMRQKLKTSLDSKLKDDNFILLLQDLEKILSQNDHLIFIFYYFNNLAFGENFFRNLYGLYQVNRQKIHFIFVHANNILEESVIGSYGEFSKLLWQNIIFFPILSKKDAWVVANRINRNYGLPRFLTETAVDLAGGHPSLIRHSLSLINKSSQIPSKTADWLASQIPISFILRDIFNTFSVEEKRLVSQLARQSSKMIGSDNYLLKMNYVNRQNHQLFSPVFEAYIEKLKNGDLNLVFDKETEQILIETLLAREKITTNEYLLLSTFLRNPNTVISRDKISKVLWGDKFCEKYSDWAIDQAIFQLRKKLNAAGVNPTILQTIKGCGYRWLR